jgi:hypothetical protein
MEEAPIARSLLGDMMSDTATMNAEDGSVVKGKDSIIAYMENVCSRSVV